MAGGSAGWETLLEPGVDTLLVFDADGRCHEAWPEHGAPLVQSSPLGQPLAALLPQGEDLLLERIRQAIAGQPSRLSLPGGSGDGRSFAVRVVPAQDGRAYLIARVESAAVPQREADFWELFEMAPLPIAIDDAPDSPTHRTHFNRRFTEVFGYTAADVPTVHQWWPLAYPDPVYREEVRREWFARLERSRHDGRPIEPMQCVVRCKDGSERIIEFRAVTIGGRNVSMFTDLTDHERATRQLARAVEKMEQLNRELYDRGRRDALTGLGNRQRLDEDLAALADRACRYGHVFAIALADIDHFKGYNDAAGHLAGDEALRKVAACMQENLRGSDAAYRFGGEEFVFLLIGQDAEAARVAMERLRENVEALRMPHPANGPFVTISVGVTAFRCDQERPVEAALLAADQALYSAKLAGRNRVVVG